MVDITLRVMVGLCHSS